MYYNTRVYDVSMCSDFCNLTKNNSIFIIQKYKKSNNDTDKKRFDKKWKMY